ncbi:APC family permease [Sciscionella sediminilitoris]|uniref:APC family permease n=1 Tax=Sciscionella sediminilitoris TaxID=1445613 RepID=UPI0004DF5A93|nr:APC family permease [Sciscionella sp. SE31]
MSESPGLRRTLSARDLIVYGLLFIGPTAPIGIFGVLDAASDGASALVFVVATLVVGFTAWSYARMSAAVPRAGSVSAYATAGLGRAPGFFAGWLAGLDYLFIPSVAALLSGTALHSAAPAIPTWLATGIAICVFTALNLAGARIAARVGMIVLAVGLVLLVVFVVCAIVVLAEHGPARGWFSPLAGTGGLTTGALLGAASVAALSFLGFDAIAGFAEENTGGPEQVGKALLFCLGLAGILFVVQTYLASLISPITPEQLAAHPEDQGTAFYALIHSAIGGWLGISVSVYKAIGPVFSALVAQAAAGRLLYGMASQGHLPGWLATVSPKTRTPRTAILLSAACTAVIAVWAALQPDGLDTLSSMVTVGALTAFVLLHASAIRYFGKRRGAGPWLLIPLAGTVLTIALLASASRLALLIAAGWLLIGVLAYLIARART